MSFIDDVKGLTAAIKTLKAEINAVYGVVKKLGPDSKAAIKDVRAVADKGGKIGRGTKVSLGTDDARITTAANGGNMMEGSLATSEAQINARRMYRMTGMTPGMARASMYGGVAQMALAPVAGAYAALPDLGTTVSRAAGYYGAAVQFGGVNLQGLQRKTMTALRGGITGLGDDAAAAAQLVQGYNYMPGSAAFTQSMREVGGAALALNMNNATAAQAIGGFQTGRMGANLYQYGIAQFDAKGNPLPQEKIARQLYDRIFQNQKGLTAKDVQMSMQYGLAGANLQTMGFSPEELQLLQYQFGQFATGKNADLAKVKNDPNNPMNAAYQINTSQTDLMQRAQDPMIKGFQDAANAITAFNKSLEGLPDEIYRLKGAIQGVSGSNLGSGIQAFTGAMASGIGSFAGGFMAMKMMGLTTKEIGKDLVKTAGKSKAGRLLKFGGKVFRVAAIADTVYNIGKSTVNMVRDPLDPNFNPDKNQSFLNAAIHGTRYVDKSGNYAGGYKGGGTTGFGASFGAKGGGSALRSPIPGVSPTTNYGAKDSTMWKGAGNKHTGQDYPVPVGTPVQSVSNGTVIDEGLGKDYGIYVQVAGDDGYQYIYAHLSKKDVQTGTVVSAGQVIGKSGDTGNVDGPHLHFEVRKGKNNPVDPKTVLGKKAPSSTSAKQSATSDNPSSSTKSGGHYANAQGIYDYLKSQGLSASGAKGVLGNLVSESGLRTGAAGDKVGGRATSYGLAQWHAGRWQNLNKFSAFKGLNPSSVEAQQAFLVHELKGYKGLWKSLSDPNVHPSTAAAMFMRQFERPLDQSNAAAARRAANIPDVKGGGTPGFGASIPSTNAGPGVVNNFTIQVQVQSASEEEAVKFAKRVQSLIEERSYVHIAGSR